MTLETFVQARAEARRRSPALLDLSELNLYRSLGALDPGRFGPVAPSAHPEAPYRCHLAERLLAHQGLPATLLPRTLVSHGVRRSLRALFGRFAAKGAVVGVPDDVYPMYGALAAETGLRALPWSAHRGIPSEATLSTFDAILVCEPLKPWGGQLGPTDVATLRRWAHASEGRLVLVDSAYASPPTSAARLLVDAGVGVLLLSMSKGFLLPDHVGLCVVPARLQAEVRAAFAALPKDTDRLRVGYAALTEHPDRPVQVAAALAALAERLDARCRALPALRAAPCQGYFAVAERPFSELLDIGVIGVPATVFGGGPEQSILSSLPVAPG